MTATQAAPTYSAPWGPSEMPTTALLTDHYELTMLRAALSAGTAHRRCVFELFARRLPAGRRYGVVAGVGRALRALRHFRFDDESLQFLRDREIVDAATADWLADFAFRGDIWGYPEGEIYFPGSPVLVVESTFAEGVVLETLLLSIYNHDSAIASAASRMTAMAGDRPCIEMGSRRTQELAAVAAARAAYIAGFAATSNLEAGRRYGVPTRGTSAHAFTLLHGTEREAFAAQIATLGEDTTLLVDTYDDFDAVRLGVELTEGRLGAVRLDSGDLAVLATRVRALAGRPRRHAYQDHGDQRPRRVHHRGTVRRPGRRLRRRHRAGHRQRPPDLRLRLQAGGPGRVRRPGRALARRWPRRAPTRPRSAAASTPSVAFQRRRHRRGGADRHQAPATHDGDDRDLLVPLVTGGEIVGEETAGGRPRAPPAGPRRAADRGAEDVARRTGHRDRVLADAWLDGHGGR